MTKKIVDRIHSETMQKFNRKDLAYLYGTMIEIPRAALLAERMATVAEFFSFGTNDLTQMGFGFSRDDIGGFMEEYLKQGILDADPFQTIDQDGIGQLIEMSTERGRKTRAGLKVGICGEQRGDPASVEFCFKAGLDYVSCSPYRVPIARIAAAQAAIKAKGGSPRQIRKGRSVNPPGSDTAVIVLKALNIVLAEVFPRLYLYKGHIHRSRIPDAV
ncbi:MAG: putative PEP-binding protein [Syntrophales bacterium]